MSSHLENNTLDLRHSLKINVTDHHDPDEAQSHETSANSQHSGLSVTIGVLNSDTSGSSHIIAELGREIIIDSSIIGHSSLGQVHIQGVRVGVLPDSSGNSS